MKIDNSYKPVGGPPGEDNRPAKGQPAADAGTQGKGVSVALSPLSSQLQAIEARLNADDVVDVERVAEIKQAIAEGRFQINPEVVAERLLATVQELIQAYRA